MLFMIHCVDKPEHGEMRARLRPDNLAYIRGQIDKVASAGPLVTDDGNAIVGSLLIMDFPNRSEAEAFVAEDPFNKAGLFETVTVTAWRRMLPQQ